MVIIIVFLDLGISSLVLRKEEANIKRNTELERERFLWNKSSGLGHFLALYYVLC